MSAVVRGGLCSGRCAPGADFLASQYLQSFGGFGQNRSCGHSLGYAKWAVRGVSDREGGTCIPDCGLLDH